MSILTRFPPRIRIANPDGTPTPEFLRMLDILVSRVGDAFGDMGADVFASAEIPAPAGMPDVFQQQPAEHLAEMVLQPAPGGGQPADITQQPLDYSAGTALALTNYRFSLKDTPVTPGTYGDGTHVAKFTVDQQGRITAAENVAIEFPEFPSGANYSGSLTGKTVVISNGIITSVT